MTVADCDMTACDGRQNCCRLEGARHARHLGPHLITSSGPETVTHANEGRAPRGAVAGVEAGRALCPPRSPVRLVYQEADTCVWAFAREGTVGRTGWPARIVRPDPADGGRAAVCHRP